MFKRCLPEDKKKTTILVSKSFCKEVVFSTKGEVC